MKAPSSPTPPWAWMALIGIVLVAATLRIASAEGGLWLDEIMSVNNIALARSTGAAGDWVALFFHDNTHALNTLYMAWVGPDASALAYRGLAIVSGTASVGVAAAIGWRRGPVEGLVAAAMIAVSYPLVHYGGEARGYAPMTLMVLAAFYLLERYLKAPTASRMAAFIAASLIGMISHLTFMFALGALGVWAMVVLFRRPGVPVVRTLSHLIVLFGLQAIAATFYGALAWNNLIIGGGAFIPASESVDIIAGLTFGSDPDARGSVSLALGLGLGWTIWLIRRKGDSSWVFFAVLVMAFPIGLALVDPAPGTVPRYFIAAAPAALVVAARGLAILLTKARWTQAVGGSLLVLFLIANGLLLDRFFGTGRGNTAGAAAYIAANAGSGPGSEAARVAGYHQFHVSTALAYTARKQGLAIRFVPRGADKGNTAEWFIDQAAGNRLPPPLISRPSGNGGLIPYELMAVFPSWGLSGDSWAVYRMTSKIRKP